MRLKKGKVNILIDGQFGSCGKGMVASYISSNNHIDISITSASANAGHSFFLNGTKYISKYIPVSAIINRNTKIYLCAGSIINVNLFKYELEYFGIDPKRVHVHPRCAVISEEDVQLEKEVNSVATHISSTQSGVGNALARKIKRESSLAIGEPYLEKFTKIHIDIHALLESGVTMFMEVPQGMDLGLSNGFSYPFCTSRDISVSAALADAQIHPKFLGTVVAVIRTYPIRAGNIIGEGGEEIGTSGPVYPDQREISWNVLGIPEEITTVTGRVRRVFTFSMQQYHKLIHTQYPDYVVLNFANYMNTYELMYLLNDLPEVTHLGFGPTAKDIMPRDCFCHTPNKKFPLQNL